MDNYVKGEVKELECDRVFRDIIVDGAVEMKVKAGSKFRNLMTFALKKFQEPSVQQIVWTGSGSQAVARVVSCVELFKRSFQDLHQVNDIRFKRIEEFWEPKVTGLDRLKVNRDIPLITILLSKTPLSSTLLGYQGPPGAAVKESSLTGLVSVGGEDVVGNSGSDTRLKRKRKPKFRNGKKGNNIANNDAR